MMETQLGKYGSVKMGMRRLNGKVALVTGATSGIGRAIAERFASEGAKVICVGRSRERGFACEQDICELYGEDAAFFLPCDLSKPEEISDLLERVQDRFSSLDVLVNCAGIWQTWQLADITPENFESTFKINTGSVIFMTKNFLEMLIKASGNIINIASVGGLQSKISGRSQYLYAASKAATIQFSQLCALNYAGQIRVNCLCPGLTDTPIFTNRDFSRFQGQIPIGHLGEPEDQAAAAVFLASDEAKFITGAVLTVDGGASLV